jgi:hypothetical protein
MLHDGLYMADVAEPLGETTSTAVTADTAATPSSSSVETSTTTPATAGDTAVATDARSVWKELAAKSEGTPPDAPPDPSLAQAATQPDGPPEAPGSLPTNGAIPLDRHKAVVTNTRRKTLAEYGIEETTQPKDVSTAVSLYGWLQKDPRGFVRMVQSQLGEDTTASAAAPVAKPVEDVEPEPDIPLQDGRWTRSADNLREWHKWSARQIQQQFEQTYGPIRDEHEERKLTEKRVVEADHIVAHAAAQWPRFNQLRPQIREYIDKHYPKGQRLPPTALQDAYIAVDREHGVQLLRAQWDAERSGQLTRKASASTVQPGAPRPSTPRPDSELSTREIAKQEWRKLAAG